MLLGPETFRSSYRRPVTFFPSRLDALIKDGIYMVGLQKRQTDSGPGLRRELSHRSEGLLYKGGSHHAPLVQSPHK